MSLMDFIPWGSAISKGLDVVKSLLGMAEKKEERNEGAIAQHDETQNETIKTLERVSAPVSNAERDSLWDDNAKKFGAGGQQAK